MAVGAATMAIETTMATGAITTTEVITIIAAITVTEAITAKPFNKQAAHPAPLFLCCGFQ
jgi:hypothetical protein